MVVDEFQRDMIHKDLTGTYALDGGFIGSCIDNIGKPIDFDRGMQRCCRGVNTNRVQEFVFRVVQHTGVPRALETASP